MTTIYRISNLKDHGDTDFLTLEDLERVLDYMFTNDEIKRLNDFQLVSHTAFGHVIYIEKRV